MYFCTGISTMMRSIVCATLVSSSGPITGATVTAPPCGAAPMRCMISSSCSAVGYETLILNMKRSSWASGSVYVPSCSIGFCVANTRNGRGSG